MKALDFMQKHHIWADSVTYAELIKCCIARGAIIQGKQVHQHVFSNGYEPKTFLINTLVNMYVKFNMLDEAQTLFDQMPERNVVSWTTMIAAYSNSEFSQKALEMLIQMLRDGVRPNMYTYSSVLRACKGLCNLAQVHCSIIKVGLESDVFVRSALIDIYSKWGELQAALCVFNEMVTGDLVVWNSIIGLDDVVMVAVCLKNILEIVAHSSHTQKCSKPLQLGAVKKLVLWGLFNHGRLS
ncbi:pentatricopeptide repeat-containing At2g03880, mitochondrial [Olea europaea subsp. europaea]|uniref:Pentatricopeptide repeat-containing At2g03880, mitochondrial n=1 Tax=Olea europaea subsp. europaea TaxID=158383 RepID=A0A8S0UG51_OLEEU|nr:pentatricopeptide repeat-containing At2g03880, mitochondrial [Olea europaea subsp. europaea]